MRGERFPRPLLNASFPDHTAWHQYGASPVGFQLSIETETMVKEERCGEAEDARKKKRKNTFMQIYSNNTGALRLV